MRLEILDHGHSPSAKLKLWMLKKKVGDGRVEGLKTMLYRPDFWGRAANQYGPRSAEAGPSPWSIGDRQLFATFTSSLNQCPW
jgi:hypothetical protein